MKMTPRRFIRWLVALTGEDPEQTLIAATTSPRRHIDITVERHGAAHVAIIQGQGGKSGSSDTGMNMVYLVGEVVRSVNGKEEIEIVTGKFSKSSVFVCSEPCLGHALRELREGDLIVINGEIEGHCVRASKLYKLNKGKTIIRELID